MNAVVTTAADRAEQAGAVIAHDCLNEMLTAQGQVLHARILHNALLELGRLKHTKRATGGFTVCMVSVIEQGLESLQKVHE